MCLCLVVVQVARHHIGAGAREVSSCRDAFLEGVEGAGLINGGVAWPRWVLPGFEGHITNDAPVDVLMHVVPAQPSNQVPYPEVKVEERYGNEADPCWICWGWVLPVCLLVEQRG